MRIKLDKDQFVETDGMSAAELIEVRQQLQATIDVIQLQMDEAALRKRKTGEYADPAWWASAKFALRRRKAQSQYLQNLIAERSRKEKQAESKNERALAHYFMDICRERMAPSVYDSVFQAAVARKEADQAREQATDEAQAS